MWPKGTRGFETFLVLKIATVIWVEVVLTFGLGVVLETIEIII